MRGELTKPPIKSNTLTYILSTIQYTYNPGERPYHIVPCFARKAGNPRKVPKPRHNGFGEDMKTSAAALPVCSTLTRNVFGSRSRRTRGMKSSGRAGKAIFYDRFQGTSYESRIRTFRCFVFPVLSQVIRVGDKNSYRKKATV